MKAFIVKFEQLFKMDTGSHDVHKDNFDYGKRKLRIPLYQREYTWTDEKIITLVNDIKRCNKYLGNIILDENGSCYEIIDGQQRITTCFLILVCMYNYYDGHQKEQSALTKLMKPYNDEFILENDSIGNYITEENRLLSITIAKENDIYYQSDAFQRAYSTIKKEIEKFNSYGEAHEFKRKLLDCEMLVLINNQHNYTHPVEQLFLDINEKAQLLQVEDIFKGHCFENYEEEAHCDLRSYWVEFKKCAMGFKEFGLNDASQYIYLYLLEIDNVSIPANLTIDGKHYLDGKTMDETEHILKEMISYGQAVLEFYNNISNTGYRFVDLCLNSYEYRKTNDHLVLKQMCKIMLKNSAAQYQKLPLMYFIYSLQQDNEIVKAISHIQFRKIITNLYIYMMLFVISGAKKSKKDIDHTIRDAIKNTNDVDEKIKQLISSARELRVRKVVEFSLRENYGFDKLAFIYSIIDEYRSNENWIKGIYSHENDHTLEHFIIPDNRNRKIRWKEANNTFEITLPADIVKFFKKNTINYLVIDKSLNESLEHDDIVSKICDIKTWHQQQHTDLPTHVSIVIKYIENMPKFQELSDIKGTNANPSTIQSLYIDFVRDYFNLENNNLQQQMKEAFINSFHND